MPRFHIVLTPPIAAAMIAAAADRGLSMSAAIRLAVYLWLAPPAPLLAQPTHPTHPTHPSTTPPLPPHSSVHAARRSPSQPLRTSLTDPDNAEAYLQYITPRPKWLPPADFVSRPIPPDTSRERISWTVVMNILDAFARKPHDLAAVACAAQVQEETARQVTTLLTVGRLNIPDEWAARWEARPHAVTRRANANANAKAKKRRA